ncbi:MAG: 3-deoxy-7-phosphoheptulonate synthase [Acutalibacteraceae bacterium]
MVLTLRKDADQKQIETLSAWLKSQDIDVHISKGEYQTIVGLIGDTSRLDTDLIQGLSMVETVTRISEPYKNANRKFHPEDTVVEVRGVKLGGGHFQLIAGPCSVESQEQITNIAKDVKKAGSKILRGGAFKPRTSPYAFQGLRDEGLKLLKNAGQAADMPVVTEIMDAAHIELFEEYADIFQVGARNMQNFELLKELGKSKKPVLLKRGLANTLQELLMSAEYIMAGGNENIILCERGIRTFETATRNTLDISAVPMLKKMSHLPVVVDPSHAAGIADMVHPLSLAAAAVGADGIMVEVHNDPAHALCDGPQALTPERFEALSNDVKKILAVVGKTMD